MSPLQELRTASKKSTHNPPYPSPRMVKEDPDEMSRNGKVEIRIFGALVSYAGTRELSVNISKPIPLKSFMEKFYSKLPEDFNSAIQKRSNVLVLVNGRETGVLDGNDTEISPGDEVVFLPVSHGGSAQTMPGSEMHTHA